MPQHEGLNRRSFLRNAGLTALAAGAAGAGAPLAAAPFAASTGTLAQGAGGKYDFDTPYNRFGTNSVKYDQQIRVYGPNSVEVGMGIADIDFKAAPSITKALQDRLQHENWGYLDLPASFTENIVGWNKRHYGVTIEPSQMVITMGVHPGLIATLKTFSPKGTKVLLQTPTYNGFYGDLTASQTLAEEVPLKLVNGTFQMDFEAFEKQISVDTNSFILCNPQNPTGNCWSAGGPAAHRRDLPEAPRRRAGRRDSLRLGDQGAEVHAVCEPAQQGRGEQQHHVQGGEQVVRPGRPQDRLVLYDQSGLPRPHQGQPPRRTEHAGHRRQPGRVYAVGRGLADAGGRVRGRQPRLRAGLHQEEHPDGEDLLARRRAPT